MIALILLRPGTLTICAIVLVIISIMHRVYKHYKKPIDRKRLAHAQEFITSVTSVTSGKIVSINEVPTFTQAYWKVLEFEIMRFLSQHKTESSRVLQEILENNGCRKKSLKHMNSHRTISRIRAIRMLGVLEPREDSIDALIGALSNRNYDIREASAFALGNLCSPRAINPLLATLEGSHHIAEYVVVNALIGIGESGARELVDALRSDQPHIRSVAARVIGELRLSQAADEISEMIKKENDQQALAVAITALCHTGLPVHGASVLIALEKSASTCVTVAAVNALGSMAYADAISAIEIYVGNDDNAIAFASASALMKIEPHGREKLENIYRLQKSGWRFAAEVLEITDVKKAVNS